MEFFKGKKLFNNKLPSPIVYERGQQKEIVQILEKQSNYKTFIRKKKVCQLIYKWSKQRIYSCYRIKKQD